MMITSYLTVRTLHDFSRPLTNPQHCLPQLMILLIYFMDKTEAIHRYLLIIPTPQFKNVYPATCILTYLLLAQRSSHLSLQHSKANPSTWALTRLRVLKIIPFLSNHGNFPLLVPSQPKNMLKSLLSSKNR